MRRFLLAILSVLAAARVYSADPLAAPLTPDCRYLFIIDTSLSMTRLQESIAASVSRMIASGLDSQMAPGEVFTIWTFNEEVQQREFPLTSWSPERGQAMSARVGEFLRSQRYRRESNMRGLINAVYQAKRFCPRLAVFLITNGEQVLVGTPFDRNINISYGRRFEELKAARVPFLTTLLCQNNDIVAWSTIAANEPVDLPAGSDGQPVVGRLRQPMSTNPKPVPSEAASAALGPVTNALTMLPGERADGGSGETKSVRKVVDISPVPDPDAPRVVAPTDVAPTPRVEMPKLPFTKTEPPSRSEAEPVAEPPVEIEESVAETPKTNSLVSVPSPDSKPATTNRAPDVVLAATENAPASTDAADRRIIIVTQIVNVAWPPQPAARKRPAQTDTPATSTSTASPEAASTPGFKSSTPTGEAAASTTKSNTPQPAGTPAKPGPTAAEALQENLNKIVEQGLSTNSAKAQAELKKAGMAALQENLNTIVEKGLSTNSPTDQAALRKAAMSALTGAAGPEAPTGPAASPTAPPTATAEPKQTASKPSFVAEPARKSTNFAGAPIAPRPVVTSGAEAESFAVAPPGPRSSLQWIYLSAAVLLLLLAGFTGWKLLTPPIDASLISKSMEDRDNG